MIRCDGCDRAPDKLNFIALYGHTMRYCVECVEIWNGFAAACEAEAKRVQQVLDLWERDTRSRLPLKLTPLDLPPLMLAPSGSPMVLG